MQQELMNPQIELSQINKLKASCEIQNESDSYAFYIYKDEKVIEKFMYSKNNSVAYWITEPGEYKVKAFVRDVNGDKNSMY